MRSSLEYGMNATMYEVIRIGSIGEVHPYQYPFNEIITLATLITLCTRAEESSDLVHFLESYQGNGTLLVNITSFSIAVELIRALKEGAVDVMYHPTAQTTMGPPGPEYWSSLPVRYDASLTLITPDAIVRLSLRASDMLFKPFDSFTWKLFLTSFLVLFILTLFLETYAQNSFLRLYIELLSGCMSLLVISYGSVLKANFLDSRYGVPFETVEEFISYIANERIQMLELEGFEHHCYHGFSAVEVDLLDEALRKNPPLTLTTPLEVCSAINEKGTKRVIRFNMGAIDFCTFPRYFAFTSLKDSSYVLSFRFSAERSDLVEAVNVRSEYIRAMSERGIRKAWEKRDMMPDQVPLPGTSHVEALNLENFQAAIKILLTCDVKLRDVTGEGLTFSAMSVLLEMLAAFLRRRNVYSVQFYATDE